MTDIGTKNVTEPDLTPRMKYIMVRLENWRQNTCTIGVIVYRIVMKNKSSEWPEYIELGFDSISLKCVKHMKTVYQDENNVVLVEKNVEWKPYIKRESRSLELTNELYRVILLSTITIWSS